MIDKFKDLYERKQKVTEIYNDVCDELTRIYARLVNEIVKDVNKFLEVKTLVYDNRKVIDRLLETEDDIIKAIVVKLKEEPLELPVSVNVDGILIFNNQESMESNTWYGSGDCIEDAIGNLIYKKIHEDNI